jgi:hypothetical protein
MLLCVGCVDEYRDWAFVQSVGGLAIGTPYRTPDGILLPISVNVSGTKAITTKPTTMNSALALKEIVVRRQGNTISLGLVTTLFSDKHSRTSVTNISLGQLGPGNYTIIYAEPKGGHINIGTIEVTP